MGAAVHGRWSGECGLALTGRKNCLSDLGDGRNSLDIIGGTSRVVNKPGAEVDEYGDWMEDGDAKDCCIERTGNGGSRSEQYAESTPRDGGVLTFNSGRRGTLTG